MKWKTIEYHGLPRSKTTGVGEFRTVEESVEVLCCYSGTVWHDFFDPEMDAEHFYENVTHYIRVDEIPTP